MKKSAIIIIAIAIVLIIAGIFWMQMDQYREGYYLGYGDQEIASCSSLLDESIEPLAGYQTIEDQNYVDVTTTPRYDWDDARLPAEVLAWESEGYSCYPMPLEFNDDNSVETVLWECEIPFVDYSYLDPTHTEIAKTFESGRYTCGLVPCLASDGSNDELILCTLE